MSEQMRNGYEDDDLRAIVTNIEEIEDEIASIMGKAKNEAKQKRQKIADIKLEAKELNIPLRSLGALLKARKLQRKLDEVAATVPDDQAEIYEDMVGQFSFLPPVDNGDSAIEASAKQRTDRAREQQEREQAEGEKLLNGAGKKHDAVGLTDAC